MAFMRTAVLVLALSTPGLAADDPAPSKQGSAAGINAVKTSSDAIVMHTRMLVRQIAPGDALRFMTHWRGPEDAFDQRTQGPAINVADTLAATTFLVTTPDGKAHALTAEVSDQRHEYWRGAHPGFWMATHAFTLDKTGFVALSTQGELIGKWKEKSAPAFDVEGEYTLQLKGTIAGPRAAFETGKLKFAVSKDVQPVQKAVETASAAIAKHLPHAKLAESGQTESGFLRGLVFENDDGPRVLHRNSDFSKQKWGYDLIRVTVSRKGELLEVAHRSVGTCVAEGVMIETPAGPKQIETLRVGEEVWGYDLKKDEKVRVKVRGIRIGEAKELITLGGGLRVTVDHPIYTTTGWLRAGDVTESHRLLASGGEVIKAASKRVRTTLGRAVAVYDLTVDEPHNYFAGGLLVHNKDRAWHAALDDPWYFYWPQKPHAWTAVYELKAE